MAKATFHADYDHHWEGGGITAYLAGFSGTVKREVLDAAIAKNAATEGVEDATIGGNEQAASPSNVRSGRGLD